MFLSLIPVNKLEGDDRGERKHEHQNGEQQGQRSLLHDTSSLSAKMEMW